MEESIAEIDIPLKPRKRSSPLFRKVDGDSVIDLIGNPDFPGFESHRKLIFMVLVLSVKDRATAVHFEPWHMEHEGKPTKFLRMYYEIDGELLELVSAPWHIWPPMIREFETMIGLVSFRHHLASWIRLLARTIDRQLRPRREGRFRLRAGDESVEVKLVAWPSDWGQRIFLTLDPVSASFSEQVRAEMKRLGLLVEAERKNYLSDSTVHPATSQRGEPLEDETGGETP